jgi:hypothetical protein
MPGERAEIGMTTRLRAILLLVSVILALVTAEAAARFHYWRTFGVPLLARPAELVYGYYPELRPAMAPGPPEQPDVLLLGASVLNQTFGDVAPMLRDALAKAWSAEVRITNVSMLGHGTLDSYYKYRWLADRRFDLVVVYHAINELRANNVPPESWRDDYGHYTWYDEINFYVAEDRLRRSPFVLPFFLKRAVTELDRTVLRRRHYVPRHAPEPEWLRFGADVKTAPVFRRNLERILALAAERDDPVLLMTFAHHLPAEYTAERFAKGDLGYGSWAGSSASPVEIWGAVDNVRAGLAVHDRVLRELHVAHPEALFVDQTARLGGDATNFVDVCHFSPDGARRFVDGIVEAVQERGLVPRAKRGGG